MANKAGVIAKINSIDTGGLNTALEVRQVLGTDPASLLENSYNIPNDGTSIIQGFAGVTTLSNVKVTKQGSRINISCIVQASTNTVNLIEIIDSEYQVQEPTSGNAYTNYYTNCALNNGETKTIHVSRVLTNNSRISCDEVLLANQSLYVNISYNTFE